MAGLRRSWIVPAVAGVVGVAVLIALGAWQLSRMDEKAALIAEIETRIAADPVPLPPDISRDDSLLRVTIQGAIAAEELHVITSTKMRGPGFRVIAPMEVANGRRILVDLGFVPQSMKDAERAGLGDGEPDSVTGLVYWPQETDSFTPEPDLGRNIWFARDVYAMAKALGTDPVMVVAQTHSLGDLPVPMPPGANLPNRHLEYVITWWSLAIGWAIISIMLVRSARRERRAPGG